MPQKKNQMCRNAQIMKEQKQLLGLQTEIEGILNKINDAINVLKVEELQLKSSAVMCHNLRPASTGVTRNIYTASHDSLSLLDSNATPTGSVMDSTVNSQELIDLDISGLANVHEYIEEDDE